MDSFLAYYLIVWAPVGYLVAFLGSIFEGDIVWFSFSFLASLGFFNFFLIALAVFLGSLVGDLFFYFLGGRLESLPPNFREKLSQLSSSLDKHIKNKPFRTLFVSKFVYGVHRAILARYGMLKIPLFQLIKFDLVATSVWMLIVGSIGYFSGLSFYVLQDYFKYTELGLLAGLLVLFLVFKLLNKKARKEI